MVFCLPEETRAAEDARTVMLDAQKHEDDRYIHGGGEYEKLTREAPRRGATLNDRTSVTRSSRCTSTPRRAPDG